MKKTIAWIVVGLAAVVLVALLLRAHRLLPLITIEGAVVESNADTRKERPIADVEISASAGGQSVTTRSEADGHFKLALREIAALSGKPVVLTLRRQNYEPLDLDVRAGGLHFRNEITLAKMVPLASEAVAKSGHPPSVISNTRVRYSINTGAQTNIGSAVKTFQVVNQGNVPCDGQSPCSPDGKWKAASGSASLYAGADNVFNNVRASCIAGPCPFTRISSGEDLQGQRNIQVTALDWSDTATFLVEAEVFHAEIRSNVRELYPVIFGRGFNFTLPPTAEGVTLEAEIDGSPMVFPLGPSLDMSWATCTVRTATEKEKIAVFRCELKPDYRF
jgi:hypothetical protein